MLNLKIDYIVSMGEFYFIQFLNGRHLLWDPATSNIQSVCFKCPFNFQEEEASGNRI